MTAYPEKPEEQNGTVNIKLTRKFAYGLIRDLQNLLHESDEDLFTLTFEGEMDIHKK